MNGLSSQRKHRLSFEFFPPKTPSGRENLFRVRDALRAFSPDFFSITYGAGGSTRDNTRDLVTAFQLDGVETAPHLSFGVDDEREIMQLVQSYRDTGVNRIVALRGDLPSTDSSLDKVRYASDLVMFMRKHFGSCFHLEVAAYPEIHPQATSYLEDVNYLKAKLDAGADSAITQYFFNIDAYFNFMDQCQKHGINKPIYPGIMPITNYESLSRFSNACGAEIPRWIRKVLDGYDDNESQKAFCVDVVSRMCERLLESGAPGLHFYTMNQVDASASIINNLRIV